MASLRMVLAVATALVATGAGAGEPTPGEPFRDCAACPAMMRIPAGVFRMGTAPAESGRAASEGPVREVRIGRAFALGVHEVTRRQFAAFVAATGYGGGVGCHSWSDGRWRPDVTRSWREPGFEQGPEHPVVCVDRTDAAAYVAWLRRKTGRAYRLPSEAEWEYAARAGTTTSRPWGDDSSRACDFANVHDRVGRADGGPVTKAHDCADGHARTAPVGVFRANRLGLHDMAGNVWEWTADCWHDDYVGAPGNGGAWMAGGDCARHVLRGGAWSSGPRQVRTGARLFNTPLTRLWNPKGYRSDSGFGFRVARSLDP